MTPKPICLTLMPATTVQPHVKLYFRVPASDLPSQTLNVDDDRPRLRYTKVYLAAVPTRIPPQAHQEASRASRSAVAALFHFGERSGLSAQGHPFGPSKEFAVHSVTFVDDTKIESDRYLGALKLAGVTAMGEIDMIGSANGCNRIFEDGYSTQIFVLDVIMPPQRLYSAAESQAGMQTGLLLARDIRNKFPGIPVILFSHLTFSDVREAATRVSENLKDCLLIRKQEVTPEDFAGMVSTYLTQHQLVDPTDRRGWFMKLFRKHLLFHPNIAGVGVRVDPD